MDVPITDELEVVVKDDGHGMSFDEVNDLYLVVGRDRRREGGELSPGGRALLGRKGIGKLAGFGIARRIEIWTVREGHLTAFRMDYDDITRHGSAKLVEAYEPEILHDRPVEATDPLQKGTLVRLTQLQLKHAVPGDRFRRSMIRRFSVLSTSFVVTVNGEPLTREEAELQFRFPDEGMNSDTVPGLGAIRWWAGFTRWPIPVEEARGISVLARGKLVQAPFFFEATGGATGQHGLVYLTGEVHADLLDEEVDLVATDRASVMWEDPRAEPLLKWGQAKIRELLSAWAKKRHQANLRQLRDTTPYMAMVERFPEREQRELVAAIDTLAKIETITDERLRELVDILIRAYENDHFMSVIRALNTADEKAYETLVSLIEEWDVIEAINTAQMVRGRVQVIRTFGSLIERKAPEKPDMQDFLKAHPWLIDPSWDMLQHERSLDKVLAEEFDSKPSGDGEGRRRLDFFCLADSSTAVVVEVKRPGLRVGWAELDQLERYVDFLTTYNSGSNLPTGTLRPKTHVTGCLVYDRLDPAAEEKKQRLHKAGMYVVTWRQLLETAERLHREFLAVVKSRAPQDDPRIQALEADEPQTTEEVDADGDADEARPASTPTPPPQAARAKPSYPRKGGKRSRTNRRRRR